MDDNHIRDLPERCLPPSILTLSLQNNHISKFPLDLVDTLPALTWCTLRGNYIETIPSDQLPSVNRGGGAKRHLDKVCDELPHFYNQTFYSSFLYNVYVFTFYFF